MKTETPIPDRIKKRPVFNGIPIPFTTFVRPDGTPDFKVTDENAWTKCITRRLCGICGEPMTGNVFFIGGERSMQSGLFFDPAMHNECAAYAFIVCPFIAGIKGYAQNLPPAVPGCPMHVVEAMPIDKPKRMGMLECRDFKVGRLGSDILLGAVDRVGIKWRDE